MELQKERKKKREEGRGEAENGEERREEDLTGSIFRNSLKVSMKWENKTEDNEYFLNEIKNTYSFRWVTLKQSMLVLLRKGVWHGKKCFNYPDFNLNSKSGITSGETSLNLHFLTWKSVITPPLLNNMFNRSNESIQQLDRSSISNPNIQNTKQTAKNCFTSSISHYKKFI